MQHLGGRGLTMERFGKFGITLGKLRLALDKPAPQLVDFAFEVAGHVVARRHRFATPPPRHRRV
jgi:hypothetical protein